jgi:hypothetical protein
MIIRKCAYPAFSSSINRGAGPDRPFRSDRSALNRRLVERPTFQPESALAVSKNVV